MSRAAHNARWDPAPRSRTKIAASFAAGIVFALGLGLAGMTQPDKVIGFLNLAGNWDPSLAFVMAAALAVYTPIYRWYRGRNGPLLGGPCSVPSNAPVDRQLVTGAALFGIGWGLGGFCPGPALVATTAGPGSAWVFVVAMALGMIAQKRVAAVKV